MDFTLEQLLDSINIYRYSIVFSVAVAVAVKLYVTFGVIIICLLVKLKFDFIPFVWLSLYPVAVNVIFLAYSESGTQWVQIRV